MPIIQDGVYKIHNVQFSDPSQVADLITGGPGPIDGITDWNAHNDKWRVKNLYQGADSNQITIESVRAPGIYAYADQAPGAPLIGSPQSIIWTIVRNEAEPGKYRIQSPNSVYIWELPAPGTNIIIVPYPPTSEADKTKWTFEGVPEN